CARLESWKGGASSKKSGVKIRKGTMMNSRPMSKLAGSTVRIRRCGIESATVTFAIVGILSRAATSDDGGCVGRLLHVGCFQRRRSRPNPQMFSRQMKPNGLAYL